MLEKINEVHQERNFVLDTVKSHRGNGLSVICMLSSNHENQYRKMKFRIPERGKVASDLFQFKGDHH